MASVRARLFVHVALPNIRQAQYGNQAALYMSLGISKISTILLTQRLFTRDMKRSWILCQIMMVTAAVWTIVSPLLVSLGCSPASIAPRSAAQTCHNIVLRYEFVVVTDAITDIVLTIVPASLCWKLQMSLTLKFQVFAVFAFRLPLAVFTVLFFKAWQHSLQSSNPGVDRSPAIIYQQAELCVSLMAATIPCLKSFIRSFDTGSGVKANFGSSSGYGSAGRTQTNEHGAVQSYKLSKIGRSKASQSRSESQTRLKSADDHMESNPRPFTSGRLTPSLPRNKSTRDLDRESQISGNELYIRRDMEFAVTSEKMPENLR